MKIKYSLSLFVLLFVSVQMHGMTFGLTLSDLPLDTLGEISKFTEIKTICVFGESCKKLQRVSDILFLQWYVASLKNSYKNIPLVFAAKKGDLFAIQKILRIRGGDVNAGNRDGKTPLYCAVFNRHSEIVKVLLEYKADVNKVSNGETPLYRAVRKGYIEIIKILLSHKADVNKEYACMTPLYWAASEGNTEIVKVLLEHKADVSKTDKYDLTPLYWARYCGHTEIIKLLKEYGAKK